jgi:hypothetical protein
MDMKFSSYFLGTPLSRKEKWSEMSYLNRILSLIDFKKYCQEQLPGTWLVVLYLAVEYLQQTTESACKQMGMMRVT